MSLTFASLNSGSNGNSYYIGSEEEAILVDAGLSCRETEKRMKTMGLSLSNIKAIFISHEHTDHITGLAGIVAKFGIPCYATPATMKSSTGMHGSEWLRPLVPETEVRIGSLRIIPFSKYHDAADPQSFIISHIQSKQTVGVFTDIGKACHTVINYFKQCHAVFLEANYDEEMLKNGKYPDYLKRRISGEKGHLSNDQALQLFREHKPAFMSHLILSHLSAENNCPHKVRELFLPHAGDTQIEIASRSGPTPLFSINKLMRGYPTQSYSPRGVQMKLF